MINIYILMRFGHPLGQNTVKIDVAHARYHLLRIYVKYDVLNGISG